MKIDGFQISRRLSTRTEARLALDEALSEAVRSVRIFDDRGEFYGFDRRPVAQALAALLRRNLDSRVLIALHDTGFVERECPRLMELIRSFAPRLQVLQTDDGLRAYARGFVLVDDSVVLRRPQFGQPASWLDHDDKAIAAAGMLFEDILGHATPALGSASL